MTARDFCYWLQGFFEIGDINASGLPTGPRALTEAQVGLIKRHLALVFAHDIDPKAGGADVQTKLNGIHFPHDPNVQVRC